MCDDSSASYIRTVHRLIEECLLFNMSREACMDALSKHANSQPVITSTVWKELEKENEDFFQEYHRSKGSGNDQIETRQKIQRMLSTSSSNPSK